MVSKHDVYSTKRILSIISVKVGEWLKRKRFMRADELHMFRYDTRTSFRDTLDQMLHELHLGYNTAMRRRLWTRLDQERTLVMIKANNQKLLDRRIMRSLEKFVGGRDYGDDLRLLQQTI
uniref:Uncharacterized protein n=1 Tax=Tanacetum cinerariifolium TaxID=118510 RepID=A0A6L2JTE5_TANCI|nr:hypothetical protein [Tanacetum cinerariifolium]